MNSYNENYVQQNKGGLYPNYMPNQIPNQIQDPNKANYININLNPIQPRYNIVNNIPTQTQINSNQQILPPSPNIIKYSPNQNANANMSQFQALNHKTSNIIYNQPPILKNNNNINIPNNQVSNMVIVQQNQLLPPYNQNINKKIINSGNNVSQNIIIQNERKNEALNDHPPIPVKLSN